MPPARRARNASTPADPGPIPADLELSRLYVKDLRSLCSRRNLTTTGGRAALINRIEEVQTNKENLPGTPPPVQDVGEHVENQNDQTALELQFQQLQRQFRSYWTGSRHKTGFYQPPSSPKYNRLFKGY